ncbi:MAG: enoyl-CoA hydratase [Micrococcaceae bacterium]|nr:enoyl-CoA hydratase [Micrococcaceae bacterium]
MSALAQVPSDFLTALGSLRKARCRPELRLEEIPAPSRLAPYAVALAAEVPGNAAAPLHGPARRAAARSTPAELATGRFILLHDPDGSDLWDGTFRIVTYIRAQLEAEIGNDQLLGSVAWTWLSEALENHQAPYRAAGGTATRILSESFGTLADRQDAIDIELRASWTPAAADVRSHLEAWSDMVCTFAGLPPLPEGVQPLPIRRFT